MYLFIESIKLLDGNFFRLDFHQKRVDETFAFFFKNKKSFDLSAVLSEMNIPQKGMYKCRVEYDDNNCKVEFVAYKLRNISSLQLVQTTIEPTSFKTAIRTEYNDAFAQRGDCDDVLLIYKGLVTDTSYCNVAFSNGSQWFTSKTPLLQGTNLSYLIAQRLVQPNDIHLSQLLQFKKIRLFNAMIEFGELELDISQVMID